jgi:hypothetical protein
MFIVAPEGLVFPDGSDRIVTKEMAPDYDLIYQYLDALEAGPAIDPDYAEDITEMGADDTYD